jgi:protein-tyrosine phosphatase
VLPKVDDGPEDLEEAVRAVSSLASGGTEVIVATPHNMPGMFETGLERIKQSAAALQDAIATREVPVKLVLGQEITFQPDMLGKLEREELLTIGETPYFLFEFPPYFVPPAARTFVFEARLQGYFPILAHPERNQQLQNDMELVGHFVEGGALMQVTASSVFGRLGDVVQESARTMLREGLVHFIATDAHSFRFGPGDMRQAVEAAATVIGESAAGDLVEANPAAVIEGRPLTS